MLKASLDRVIRSTVSRNGILLQTFSRRCLSDHEYHKVADESLETLVDDLETYFDKIPSAEIDIQYSQGVVTLQMGSKGTYVINKQAPNKQIWLSSPLSGPFRYEYENGEWTYKRDRHKMKEKLREELASLYLERPFLH